MTGSDNTLTNDSNWFHGRRVFASWSAYLLLCQSLVLLFIQNESGLKLNLLMQITALTCLAAFSKRAAGTYLNAPLVFSISIFMWHSSFLVGYYFELDPIFLFSGDVFNIGFEHIYKATALVGLSLSLTIVGIIWGYRREVIETGSTSCEASMQPCYASVGLVGKRVAWYLFAVMACILVLFIVRDGSSVFGGKYLDLYANVSTSLSSVLFFRSEFFWVFAIMLLIASYRDNRRVRSSLAVLVVAVCVLLAMLGPRTGPFICLTALLLSWDCFVRRVKLRWIAVFVVFLSAASYVIVTTRGEGLGAHVFQFGDTREEKLDLLHLFYEQGESITVVLRTMEFGPQNGLMYGRTFVDSVVSVIPLPILSLVGYRFAEAPANWIVDNSPDIPLDQGEGSSLIAELYYNFGMIGSLGFLIIGWFISRAYFKYALTGNVFTGLNVMTVVSMYTVMMRNDTAFCWRLLIYAFIIVALLKRKRVESFLSSSILQRKNLLRSLASSPRPKLIGPVTSNGQF